MPYLWPGLREITQCHKEHHAEEDGGEDEQLTMKLEVDLPRLPPCRFLDLIPYIACANHGLANDKKADQMIF